MRPLVTSVSVDPYLIQFPDITCGSGCLVNQDGSLYSVIADLIVLPRSSTRLYTAPFPATQFIAL